MSATRAPDDTSLSADKQYQRRPARSRRNGIRVGALRAGRVLHFLRVAYISTSTGARRERPLPGGRRAVRVGTRRRLPGAKPPCSRPAAPSFASGTRHAGNWRLSVPLTRDALARKARIDSADRWRTGANDRLNRCRALRTGRPVAGQRQPRVTWLKRFWFCRQTGSQCRRPHRTPGPLRILMLVQMRRQQRGRMSTSAPPRHTTRALTARRCFAPKR